MEKITKNLKTKVQDVTEKGIVTIQITQFDKFEDKLTILWLLFDDFFVYFAYLFYLTLGPITLSQIDISLYSTWI